ncbi:MAG: SOS response-associated peptidase [Pseudomonadota bacterium]
MCGRFTLTNSQYADIARSFGIRRAAPDWAAEYRPRFNVAPGDFHLILRPEKGEPILERAEWGLIPSWAKEPRGFMNARLDSADVKPAFRSAFRSRRCAIPADGFFEWTGDKTDRRPYWFRLEKGGLFAFAGLFEDWTDPKLKVPRRTFTILTTEAQGAVREIHDRMPVILEPDQADEWLEKSTDPKAFVSKLPPPNLVASEVSKRVNSPRNDDPSVLESRAG